MKKISSRNIFYSLPAFSFAIPTFPVMIMLPAFFAEVHNFDIAITRAGASTLAELTHLNIPFIAIPFPHAIDNHQFWNAKRYFDLNCCWILEEKNFMPGDIYKIIDRIMVDKNEYFLKKNNLKKLNENNTWQNINKKLIKYFNEN